MRKFGPKVIKLGGSRIICTGKFDSSQGILNLYCYNPLNSTTIEITNYEEMYNYIDNTIFATIVDSLILNNEQLITLFADSDNNTNKIQPDQIITQKLSSPFLISAQNYLNEAQSRLEQQKSEEDENNNGHTPSNNHALNSSIESAKRCISLIRKVQRMYRTISISNSDNNDNYNQGQIVLSEAYMCMYTAYKAMNKHAKAKSCLVLAHKNKHRITDTNINELPSISNLNITDNKTNTNGSDSSAIDIENLQDLTSMRYSSKQMDEEFQFSCTMCGECCRSADNILITPLDLFRMTRCASLRGLNVTTTKQLLSHSRFKAALHFVLKDGLPIARLRPVKSSSGQCHFAYPLYSTTTTTTTTTIANPSQLLSFEEQELLSTGGSSQIGASPVMNSRGRQALGCLLGPAAMPTMCASYPVAPELTEADFWHVRRQFWRTNKSNSTSSSSDLAEGWQEEEDMVIVHSTECEGFHSFVPPSGSSSSSSSSSGRSSKTPIRNGRLINDSNSTYNSNNNNNSGSGSGAGDVAIYTLRDFLRGPKDKTRRSYKGDTVGTQMKRDTNIVTDINVDVDVEAYISEEVKGIGMGVDVASRWDEYQWFMGLLEDVLKEISIPVHLAQSYFPQSWLIFSEAIAKILYNFDSLPEAKSRPIKSEQRLQRDITQLVKATVKGVSQLFAVSFSTNMEKDGVRDESQLISDMRTLLERLNVSSRK